MYKAVQQIQVGLWCRHHQICRLSASIVTLNVNALKAVVSYTGAAIATSAINTIKARVLSQTITRWPNPRTNTQPHMIAAHPERNTKSDCQERGTPMAAASACSVASSISILGTNPWYSYTQPTTVASHRAWVIE